jgi:hypothetical protein
VLVLRSLKAEQESLSKKINKKVLGMFEKAEQEYHDLMKKKAIIEKDKAKIEEVIVELDRKKYEALESTWKKVTKDFGSIFSTLLPGTPSRNARSWPCRSVSDSAWLLCCALQAPRRSLSRQRARRPCWTASRSAWRSAACGRRA